MAPAHPRDIGEIIATTIRSKRSAQRLSQESVASRMRALGFKEWTRQTVGSTERPTRRVTAAEAIGLALALDISLPGLLRPDAELDVAVQFPTGAVPIDSIEKLVSGMNDHSITWDGDLPVFKPGESAWWGAPPAAGES